MTEQSLRVICAHMTPICFLFLCGLSTRTYGMYVIQICSILVLVDTYVHTKQSEIGIEHTLEYGIIIWLLVMIWYCKLKMI